DIATGVLTYTGVSTSINNSKAGAVSIYPTLTKGSVTVANAKAATIEISNVAGVTVQSVKSTDDNTTLQLSALSNGAYIVKVRLADGSVKVQKVILQK
ncbi:MAG: T9SS type A sorting domain-containing protein, partial [Bacteroidota bacterium]|nr:T9SS type A sorting domain-containing protein [Bacteroidota bacterium]